MSDDVVARIAALIAGGTDSARPPAWLSANIPALIEMVRAWRSTRRRDAHDVHDALKSVQRTAGTLTNAPNNPDVMDHLAKADPAVPPSGWIELLASAPEIARQAGLALKLVPEGQGRSSGIAPTALRGRLQCAAIVSEAWQAVRARPGVPNSEEAYRAADLLWHASGRTRVGKAQAVEGWRRDFARLERAETNHPDAFAIIRAAVTAQPPDAGAIEASRRAVLHPS